MADFEPDDRDDDVEDKPKRRTRRRDEFDDEVRPKKNSNTILIVGIVAGVFFVFGLCLCAPIGIGLLLPAIQKVREVADAKQKSNNMKQIGLGKFNYESSYRSFANNTTAKDPISQQRLSPVNNPLMPKLDHSWRVQILPYIEAEAVFKDYDFSKPWNDPKNAALGATRIPQFAADETSPNTRIFGFAGYGTMLEPNVKVQVNSVTDGTSNTILYAQFDIPGPWHQPNDHVYHVIPMLRKGDAFVPTPPLPPIFQNGTKPAVVLMADGSVKRIQPGISPAAFMAFVGRSDGTVTDNSLLEPIP